MVTKKQIKTITALIISAILLTLVITPLAKAEEREIKVVIDGNEVTFPDQKPIIDENGRVLVPIRTIAEKFYCDDIKWDAQERKVTIVKNRNSEIILWLDSKKALVNGEEKELDTSAKAVNGRTMLPLRFISETFNSKVDWDSAAYTVKITKPQYSPYVDYTKIKVEEDNTVTLYVKLKDNLPDDIAKLMQNKKNIKVECKVNEKQLFILDSYNKINIDVNLNQKVMTVSNVKFPSKTNKKQVINYTLLIATEENSTASTAFAKFDYIILEADPNAEPVEVEKVEYEKGDNPNTINLIITLTKDPGHYVTVQNIEIKKYVNGKPDNKLTYWSNWESEQRRLSILKMPVPEPADELQEVTFVIKYNGGDREVTLTYVVPKR
ncbi:copper amine oxidase N-terminal domain-containing protein [Thermovenabulum sp.]|uniref:copper amine oxidase N-terminal domain-containing protein n=1 Tax=Thermovenabulum sp. TaxID=3100335 RepID=UPI003C7A7437